MELIYEPIGARVIFSSGAASTLHYEAERLGIAGYAINLPDGTVEVLACGPSNALDELADWLQSGPPMASVTRVDVRDSGAGESDGFRIG